MSQDPEYYRKYYEENRARILEKRKAEYSPRPRPKLSKDEALARKSSYQKKYYHSNRSRIIAMRTARYEMAEKQGHARWLDTNWTKRLYYAASRGRRALPCTITPEWIATQLLRQDGKCYWSGLSIDVHARKRGLRMPSLDRIDPARGYTEDNVVLCIWAMNAAKGTASKEDFLSLLADLRSTV